MLRYVFMRSNPIEILPQQYTYTLSNRLFCLSAIVRAVVCSKLCIYIYATQSVSTLKKIFFIEFSIVTMSKHRAVDTTQHQDDLSIHSEMLSKFNVDFLQWIYIMQFVCAMLNGNWNRCQQQKKSLANRRYVLLYHVK